MSAHALRATAAGPRGPRPPAYPDPRGTPVPAPRPQRPWARGQAALTDLGSALCPAPSAAAAARPPPAALARAPPALPARPLAARRSGRSGRSGDPRQSGGTSAASNGESHFDMRERRSQPPHPGCGVTPGACTSGTGLIWTCRRRSLCCIVLLRVFRLERKQRRPV